VESEIALAKSKKFSRFFSGLLVGFAAAAAIFFALNYSYLLFQSNVENTVKKFYELALPGSTVEVVSLKEESGLYKVLSKVTTAGTVSYLEAYVTRDGKLLTTADSTILIERSIEQIEKSKNFIECLFNKNLRIFGVLNQTANPQGAQATLIQLNLLGRLYSPKLFISCDGDLVQQCIAAGVTQVPSVVFNNSVEPGIKTVDWFESKTGCKS
jgi:hypothetical protein